MLTRYDELIKRMRNCATQAAPCKTCDMIEDGSCSDTLIKQAADAIEELQKRVPKTPHGRLIDADALIAMCKTMEQIEWNNKAAPYSWAYAYESFESDIDEMPTIIESEGEDD